MNKELLVAVDVVLAVALLSLMAAGPPSGFAVLTKSAYVSGNFVSKLTLNFDKEYTGVQNLVIETIPGSTSCSVVIEVAAYDANGNAVATFKMPNTAAHKTGTVTKNVDNIKVKKVTAKVTGSWPACGYLDNLKVTLTYSKPAITPWVSFSKKSSYDSNPNIVAGWDVTLTGFSKDGIKISSIVIKVDGTAKSTCKDASSCTSNFIEPASNIGKTRTYTIEATDKDGDKTSISGSYKVYGIMDKSSTSYGTYDTTIDLGHEYTTTGMNIYAQVGGTDGGCRISPKVAIYDAGGKQTGSFDLNSILIRGGGTSGWKAFPQTIRAAKIRIYVDNPTTGCYRYVSKSTATVHYSAPAVS